MTIEPGDESPPTTFTRTDLQRAPAPVGGWAIETQPLVTPY
jgi:hypothetical protein